VSFSQEQSALENARQHLAYLPISTDEMEARLAEIRDFTELGEYFTQPVKRLSLGMRVRAEFAVATARPAGIVVIDEVLGAGDIYWAEKIARRMEQLCARSTTLLLVSHSLAQINRYCERAVWIERGRVVMDGPVLEVTKRYEGFLERLRWHTDDLDDKTIALDQVVGDLGNETLKDSGQKVVRWPGRGDVVVTGVWLNGRAVTRLVLSPGAALSFRLALRATRGGEYCLRYLFTFWDENGKRAAVLENDADHVRLEPDLLHETQVVCLTPGLTGGEYQLTLTVTDALRSTSTIFESAIRFDALYKSFVVQVIDGSDVDNSSPRPIYRIPLLAETL
jgi:energy-coupling factor transporter ATP-binding protein EcfA2